MSKGSGFLYYPSKLEGPGSKRLFNISRLEYCAPQSFIYAQPVDKNVSAIFTDELGGKRTCLTYVGYVNFWKN